MANYVDTLLQNVKLVLPLFPRCESSCRGGPREYKFFSRWLLLFFSLDQLRAKQASNSQKGGVHRLTVSLGRRAFSLPSCVKQPLPPPLSVDKSPKKRSSRRGSRVVERAFELDINRLQLARSLVVRKVSFSSVSPLTLFPFCRLRHA